MKLFRRKTNWLQILIGLLVLIIGSLVYIVDRPPGQTYFITKSTLDISLYNTLPNLFGTIGNILPDFSHVFAFILLTAGILSTEKTGCMVVTTFWFLTDILFEFGQNSVRPQQTCHLHGLNPFRFWGIPPFISKTEHLTGLTRQLF